MRISTEIDSVANLVGEEKAVEYFAKAGFDCWDFSMFKMVEHDWRTDSAIVGNHPLSGNDYLKFARKLKQIGLDNGIVCNQAHAPFPSVHKGIKPYLKRAIECTAEAGGKIIIIHPGNYLTAEENAEFYFELLPFAKDCGVKIATENMWCWDDEKDQSSFAACINPKSFNKHLDLVNDDYFVACLDIGHAEMRGSETNAVEMIKALGNRLKALHIHDNDLWHDSHQLPFTMDIDFSAVVKALKEIDYQGDFTLEANAYPSGFTSDTAFECCKNMASVAKKLVRMFEEA